MSAQPVPTDDLDGFVRVCRLDELPEVGAAAADIDGTIVAIVRDQNGHVHAVNDTCTHGQVSLSEGEVEGCQLECWLHGSRFDLCSGKPTSPPATVPIAVYDVRIDAGEVHVRIGGPPARRHTGVAAADVATTAVATTDTVTTHATTDTVTVTVENWEN